MSTGRRIILNEDDFNEPAAETRSAPTPSDPPALPPVMRSAPIQVGRSPAVSAPQAAPLGYQSSGSILNNPQVAAIVAAAVGMFLAWGFAELTGLVNLANHARSWTQLSAYVGVWTMALEAVFVFVLVGFDRFAAGAFESGIARGIRALIPALAIGWIAGFVAQEAYRKLLENASFDLSPNSGRFYLARAIGWAIFGVGAGMTLGVADRTMRRSVNGAIGGLVGGALGGVVFEAAAVNLHTSSRVSRLLGLLAIALLVALATRAVEAVRKDAWLRVIGGGMAGKEFILYHTFTRLGSSPDCEIYLLKDPAVEPVHAQIEERGARRILTASPAAPVIVNGAPATSHELRSGDTVQVGNTVIAYSERSPALAAY